MGFNRQLRKQRDYLDSPGCGSVGGPPPAPVALGDQRAGACGGADEAEHAHDAVHVHQLRWRAEIADAAKALVAEANQGGSSPGTSRRRISPATSTSRTCRTWTFSAPLGGAADQQFLIWQSAYAEMVYQQVLF